MKLRRIKIKSTFITALLAGVALASSGRAALITPPLQTFVLTNTTADGSVTVAADGFSFVLTGGNTGSGIPGTTNFTAIAQVAGTVQFEYSYTSLDSPDLDSGGYLLGNTRFELANTDGDSGFSSFTTSPGQSYGWYVNTVDNTGEPGILTIAISPVSATVPEPAGIVLSLIGIAAIGVTSSRLVRASNYKEKTV